MFVPKAGAPIRIQDGHVNYLELGRNKLCYCLGIICSRRAMVRGRECDKADSGVAARFSLPFARLMCCLGHIGRGNEASHAVGNDDLGAVGEVGVDQVTELYGYGSDIFAVTAV